MSDNLTCPASGSSKINWFSVVLGTMSTVFPTTYLLTKAVSVISDYISEFLLSSDAFQNIFPYVNYFIPLDFILFSLFFYYTFMMAVLVAKWTLKIIPFIG
ncbi:hypothetical protein [Caminibacter sp.]